MSLFGFDADGDHYRLTREINGRRINLALPAESLLMEKSAGKVPHTGGQRIKEGDEYWNTLIRWLDAGVPRDPATVAKPIGVELYPETCRARRQRGSAANGRSCRATPTAPSAT